MGHQKKLYDNLRNTEIDIVLVTPKYLYIGEAKDESRLDVKYGYVLMHQLIRQYVMAAILLDWIRCDKEIVPFVIGHAERLKCNHKNLKHINQVNFMLDQVCAEDKTSRLLCLREEHILTWAHIEKLASSAAQSD